MSKKIENKDLVQGNPFQPTQDQAVDFKKVIDSLNRSFKKNEEVYQKMIEQGIKLASIKPLQGYDNIKEIERGIKQVERANKSLISLKQKEQQLSSKVSKLRKQEEAQLKKTKRAINKLQKTEAKILESKKKQEEEVNKLSKQEERNLKLKERLKDASSDLAKENALLEEQAKRQERSLKDEAKATLDAQKETKELTKEEQKNFRLKEELIHSTSELAKENALLQEELNRNKKANREDAKAALDSSNEYKKLEKEVREAQQEFKRLAAQYGVNSQQALEAEEAFTKVADRLKEIDDRARDGSKSVGLYAQELSGLQEETKAASDSLKQIILEFGGNSKEAKNARKELRQLTKTLDNVEQQARDAAQGITRLESSLDKTNQKLTRLNNIARGLGLIALFNAFTEAVKGTDEGADGLQRGIGRLTLSLTAIVQALFKVGTAFKNGKGFLDAFSEGFENFGEGLEDSFKALDEQVRLTREYRKAAANASTVIAELTKQRELLMLVTDDSNTGLIEQFKLLTDLEEVTIELGAQQELLAKQQLAIAQERFKTNKESTANLEALKEAEKALIEVQKERITNEIEINRRRREIISDLSELELDILIDGADNQKTINERIISDAAVSLERRRKIFEETQKFLESSLQGQVFTLEESQKRIREFEAQDLESRNKILRDRISVLSSSEKSEKENADKILQTKNQLLANENQIAELRKDFTIDINKLLQESDFDRLNAEISNLGLSEKLQTRLLEIIRERKTAIRDLTETNKDLSESERESLEVQSDITLQAEALQKLVEKRVRFQKTLEELEEARRKQEIENITKRLETVEEGSEEELKLRQELLDKLIDQEAEAGRKIVEQRVKIQRATSQVLTGFSEKFFEGQINRLDEQLEAVRRRSDEIRELSQRNVQSAGDALAFQQRREAELERERERERKKQQKSKLLFAILDTVSAKAAAGDDQPLKNAIFEGALLSAFVEAFPSFDTGVDVTGKGNVDGKGGFFSVLHPNETVLSAKDRAAMGNPLSRKDIIANYNLGKSVINQTVQADHSYSAEIISGLQDVKQAIKAKPALTEFKVNELAGMVTTIIEQQGNKQRFMQKYTRKH